MNLITNLKQSTAKCLQQLYGVTIQPEQVLVNATKPEFEGDYTIVLFAFVKQLGKSPEVLGNELGAAMLSTMPGTITQFNIVKGFLNFSISNQFWFDTIKNASADNLLPINNSPRKIMVEYSSIILRGLLLMGNK